MTLIHGMSRPIGALFHVAHGLSNAMLIKAVTPEMAVCVDGRCCAGVTPKSHENALEAMRMCQVEIL